LFWDSGHLIDSLRKIFTNFASMGFGAACPKPLCYAAYFKIACYLLSRAPFNTDLSADCIAFDVLVRL